MKDAILRWIKQQVKACGTRGAVVGLSGGLDSSVVAALLQRSLGGDRVQALILPIHSQQEDLDDAALIAKNLDLRAKKIDLSGLYDDYIGFLTVPAAKAVSSARKRMASANLKSRLRMAVFYYYANSLDYLVCGTSNKSEIMTGYFTKYGDGAADILPLGGLLKFQVRSLARELGLPERIIAKPPTAGLWPGQTDEGEMGVTYDEIDEIIQKGRLANCSKKAFNKVGIMVRTSGHKRQPAKMFIPPRVKAR